MGRNREDQEYWVTLKCRHRLLFRSSPPYVGEEMYCLRCAAPSAVAYAPHEGRACCEDCGYVSAGHFGLGPARQRAQQHLATKRGTGHRVRVLVGRRIVAREPAEEISA